MTTDHSDILLVEDSAHDAELTMRALAKGNLANQIVWMKDGVTAMEFLSGRAAMPATLPQVILLDIKLPRMTGIEVLAKIRKDDRLRTLPVVMLTSSSEEPDIKQCYLLGVNSYVVKPVKFNDFTDAVAKLGLYWLLVNHVPKGA